jgi:hypothetical protein
MCGERRFLNFVKKTMRPLCLTSTFILLTAFLALVCGDLSAQHKRSGSRMWLLGIEGGLGTRSYQFISKDIPELDGLSAAQTGFNAGLMAGTGGVQIKLRKGFFRTSELSSQTIAVAETEFAVRAFPFFNPKSKSDFFRPYITLGIDRHNVKLHGDYDLPQQTLTTPSQPLCDPDMGVPNEKEEDPAPSAPRDRDSFLGNKVFVRFNPGAGMAIQVAKDNYFINFFMEVTYGMVIGDSESSLAFDNTTATASLAANTGIAIGLRKKK